MPDEHEIRIEADALRYTRDGLESKDAIPLRAGRHNRLVIERPARVDAIAASHGGFPEGSAFPLPALLSLLLFEHVGNLSPLFDEKTPRAGVYQVYGHTDASGSDAQNKRLSERRAHLAVAC